MKPDNRHSHSNARCQFLQDSLILRDKEIAQAYYNVFYSKQLLFFIEEQFFLYKQCIVLRERNI